jgi:hypothetical protein
VRRTRRERERKEGRGRASPPYIHTYRLHDLHAQELPKDEDIALGQHLLRGREGLGAGVSVSLRPFLALHSCSPSPPSSWSLTFWMSVAQPLPLVVLARMVNCSKAPAPASEFMVSLSVRVWWRRGMERRGGRWEVWAGSNQRKGRRKRASPASSRCMVGAWWRAWPVCKEGGMGCGERGGCTFERLGEYALAFLPPTLFGGTFGFSTAAN